MGKMYAVIDCEWDTEKRVCIFDSIDKAHAFLKAEAKKHYEYMKKNYPHTDWELTFDDNKFPTYARILPIRELNPEMAFEYISELTDHVIMNPNGKDDEEE